MTVTLPLKSTPMVESKVDTTSCNIKVVKFDVQNATLTTFNNTQWSNLGNLLDSENEVSPEIDLTTSTLYNLTILDPTYQSITSPHRGSSSLISSLPNLRALTIPTATDAGACVFSRSSTLTTANLPTLQTLGVSTFSNNPSLKTVTIPNVKHASQSSFLNCPSLTTLTLPPNFTCSHDTFKGCYTLEVLASKCGFLSSQSGSRRNYTSSIARYLRWRSSDDLNKDVRYAVVTCCRLVQDGRADTGDEVMRFFANGGGGEDVPLPPSPPPQSRT